MTKPPDFDTLVDALRSDLPTDAERERIQARLLAAGVAVGVGIAAPNTAAAAASVASANAGAGAVASGAQTSLLVHAAGLSLTAKLGVLAVVVAAGASVPIAMHAYAGGEHAQRAPINAHANDATDSVALGASAATPVAPATHAVAAVLAPSVVAAAEPRVERPAAPNSVAIAASAPAQIALANVNSKRRSAQSVQQPTVTNRAANDAANDARALPQAAAADTAAETATTSAVPSVSAAATATPTPKPAPSSLRDEAELLGRALAALRAHDREGARAALAAHAARYPHGMLERERDRVAQRIDDTTQTETP